MAFITIGVVSVFMWVAIFMMILLLVGTFILQIFLSKIKNPWAGLILPGITFTVVLSLCMMTPDFSTAWLLFCRGNVGTLIYLAIYFFFRFRRKKK